MKILNEGRMDSLNNRGYDIRYICIVLSKLQLKIDYKEELNENSLSISVNILIIKNLCKFIN